MKRGWPTAVLITAALLLDMGAAFAAASSWPIDTAHSSAQFSVRTLWFTHERGSFDALYGELRSYDAQHDVVDAWIDAGSLRMDDAGALAEARGAGFFDVAHYPRIHFVSAPFPVDALAGGGALQGILDLRGERVPVQFTLLPSACPAQPPSCAIHVQGDLSRGAFGMHTHRGLLSDRVALDLNIVLLTRP